MRNHGICGSLAEKQTGEDDGQKKSQEIRQLNKLDSLFLRDTSELIGQEVRAGGGDVQLVSQKVAAIFVNDKVQG